MEAKTDVLPMKALVLASVLTLVLFAGCLGGDDGTTGANETPGPVDPTTGEPTQVVPKGPGRVIAPPSTLQKERSWTLSGNASESFLLWVPILNATKGDTLNAHVKATASGGDAAYLFPPTLVNPDTARQPNRGGIGYQMASQAPYVAFGDSVDWDITRDQEITHGNESGVAFLFGATSPWTLEIQLAFSGSSWLAVPEERRGSGIIVASAAADVGNAGVITLDVPLSKPAWTLIVADPPQPLLGYREHELVFPDNGNHNGEGEILNATGNANQFGEILRNMLWVGRNVAASYRAEMVVAQTDQVASLRLVAVTIDLDALPGYFSGPYGGYF